MSSRILTIGFVLAITGFASAADKSEAIAPTEPIKLFNGKDLTGFYTWMKDTQYEDPRRVFRVTDGMLHVTGDGLGGILTKKEYRDYHLVLEFKWGTKTHGARTEKTKDSGLLVHSVGTDGNYNGQWMTSIEVQIIEGGVGDFIIVVADVEKAPGPFSLTVESARDRDNEVIWQKGGKREIFDLKNRKRINWFGRDPDWEDKIGFRGKQDVESPDGQWTRLDVVCDGGHIQTYVNGVMVNEAFDVQPSQGKIQLQTELAEIFFRRLELYAVGKGPKPAKAE